MEAETLLLHPVGLASHKKEQPIRRQELPNQLAKGGEPWGQLVTGSGGRSQRKCHLTESWESQSIRSWSDQAQEQPSVGLV